MYNEFYGFSEKPFEDIPDPKFIYLTSSHRKTLTSVIDSIKSRKGFISITGEVGTGKTILIQSLFGALDEKVKKLFIFHTSIGFKELLKSILRKLDLLVKEQNKERLLNQLNEYLLHKIAQDEVLAVIIDEAQSLSQEVMGEFEKLWELGRQTSGRLQIVFVGQPAFEEKVGSPGLRQFNQKIRMKHQIKPLSEEESKEYIDHRLKLVGSSSSAIFTPQAISMICRHARGIPRTINILCDNALMKGYRLSQKRIDVDVIRQVIKDLEGPQPENVILDRILIVILAGVKKFRLLVFRFNRSYRRVFFITLSLLCLGGLIFLIHGSLQQHQPTIMQSIKSIKEPRVETKPSLLPTSPQTPAQGISKGERDVTERVITVEKGETLAYMAQKYFGISNPTLVDLILEFNPKITNIHLILIDQTIKLPKITEELLIVHSLNQPYQIHAGTFGSPDVAKVYSDEPILKGRKIEILPRRVSPKETWYRVMIGEFNNRDDALKVIGLLKGKKMLPLLGDGPQMGWK